MAGAEKRDGLRILSLDGPPVAAAALSEPLFLQQIAHRWAFNEEDEEGIDGEDVHVSDMFDIIGGCGVGGLYAILFARLNMTIGQVIQFHHTLQDELFGAECWAQMDHEQCMAAFNNALDQMVSDFGIDVDLNSSFLLKNSTKCFIVVLNETTTNTPLPRMLRTCNVRTGPSPRCTIRQALHATLADLDHLPAIHLEGESFIGASAVFPNVSRILMTELATAFRNSHVACFVNLGADSTCPVNHSHIVGQDLKSQFGDLDCYFRLSLKEEIHPRSKIKPLVMGYLHEYEVSKAVDDIVDAVKSRGRVVTMLRFGNLAAEDGKTELRRNVMHILADSDIKKAREKLRSPFDFKPPHQNGCYKGTREDVLQPVETWAQDDDAPNIFWLDGYPGTGKTAICITLKQRLAEAGLLGASCFFRREFASQHNSSTLFRSIASQLLDSHDSIRDNIVQAVNTGEVKFEGSAAHLFQQLLVEPLTASSNNVNQCIVVVLDALDEFGQSDNDRMNLVKLLLPEWIQLPKRFKLFIASRSQGHLPLHLNRPDHQVRRLEVGNATSEKTQQDIRTFFEHNFEELQNNCGGSSPLVEPSDLDELVTASAGLFIWASTVVKMVNNMRKHVRDILRDLRERKTTVGETKMVALNLLYSTLLEPLLEHQTYTVTVLSAVICAKTPLTASTLSPLCELHPDVIEDIARTLGPVMDTANGLRFVHKSFFDYLTSQYCEVPLSIPNAELMLVTSCLRIMHARLHFNMGQMPSSDMLNSEVFELHKALSLELQYASRFWGVHLKFIQDCDEDKKFILTWLIENFLNLKFLYWVEAVSILGCIREAMDGLSTLNAAGFDKAVRDFAQDSLAFLRQFAFPISQSYPHIYVSALSWTPENSVIRRRYLHRLCHGLRIVSNGDEIWPVQLVAIQGHEGQVLSVAFSTDGSLVASGSSDNTARIWDATTGQAVGKPFRGHTLGVNSVAFSPDGTHIVSGSQDTTIRIWNISTGKLVERPLQGHTGMVNSVAFSPDGFQIISGSSDSTVRIWDAATGQPVSQPFRGYNIHVQTPAVSPDGSDIVSGSSDNAVQISDAATGQPVEQPFRGHSSAVYSLSFSRDGYQLISGTLDKTVRAWRPGEQPTQPPRGRNYVNSLSFPPSCCMPILLSTDAIVQIWDIATGQFVGQSLQDHNHLVTSLAFSSNGSRLVCGSAQGTVQIWNTAIGQPVGQPLQGHTEWVASVAFSPDGTQIVSGSWDKTIRIWDTATAQSVRHPPQGHDGQVRCVAFSPDGSRIVSGSTNGTIWIWDAATGQPVGEPLEGHTLQVNSISFSPDGSQFVSGSWDGTVRIWDAVTGLQVGKSLEGHSMVHCVAFLCDGFHVISWFHDATVWVWNAFTRQPVGHVQHLQGRSGWVGSAAFSPNRSQIVRIFEDNTVQICDAATGLPLGERFHGHNDTANDNAYSYHGTIAISTVAFSQNGSYIASGSNDKTIQIWDPATGQPLGESIRGHTREVTSVAFSPDGSQIVSGSYDKTVRIWDVATGQPLRDPFQGHTLQVNSVTFSPDGSHVISGSADKTVRIWNALTDQPVRVSTDTSTPLSFPRPSHPAPLHCFLRVDGWVVDQYDHRLVWIPQHLHEFLPTLGLVEILGRRRMIVIDASDMRTGEEWSSCWKS